MDIFSVIRLLGGLAMFLYGMEIMGDGLKNLSGSALKNVLGKAWELLQVCLLLRLFRVQLQPSF